MYFVDFLHDGLQTTAGKKNGIRFILQLYFFSILYIHNKHERRYFYMGKLVEGLWNCPFCDNKRIRAGQKTCPNCGHPQDENTKFYMPGEVNPPRLIRFREYRRGFQTPHGLSSMPATLGRSGYLTTDTAQTQRLCRAALPSAGASGFALDAQSTA